MPKIGVNDKCYCNSDKKYKKCCMKSDNDKKIEQMKLNHIDDEIFKTGQLESTDKMYEVLDFFKLKFPKFSLIDITSYLKKDNYKVFLTKNYYEKIIMFAEKTEKNEEFFNSKSNSTDNDIMIMYAGGYKVIDSNNILVYSDDMKAWIGS